MANYLATVIIPVSSIPVYLPSECNYLSIDNLLFSRAIASRYLSHLSQPKTIGVGLTYKY
jgi:hypothetical protein